MSDCMIMQDGILAGKWVIVTGTLYVSLPNVVDSVFWSQSPNML